MQILKTGGKGKYNVQNRQHYKQEEFHDVSASDHPERLDTDGEISLVLAQKFGNVLFYCN